MAELESLRVAMTADVSDFKQELKSAGYSVDELQTKLKDLNKDIDEALQIQDSGKTLGKEILGDDYDSAMSNAMAEIDALKERIAELQGEASSGGVSALSDQLGDLKKIDIAGMFKNATKQIVKASLAMVGIRSAYLGIRKAMSQYLSQNEELQNKLNACYYAIGSLLAPALEKIVNIFVKIVSYVNVFLKALGFAGINMSNFNKNASSSAKSINKMTAGFDELNNINNDETSSSGSSVSNPFEDVELDSDVITGIEEFANFCKENLPLVIGLLAELALAIIAIKTSMDFTMFAGLATTILGITIAVQSFVDYMKDPSWENFSGILYGIAIAVGGLAIVFGSLPLAIVGAVIAVVATISYFHDEIDGFITNISNALQEAFDWVHENLTNSSSWIVSTIGWVIESLIGIVKGFIDGAWQMINGIVTGLKQVVDGIVQMFKGDLKGGLQTALNGIWTIVKSIVGGIWTFIKSILNSMISGVETAINSVIRGINKLTSGLRSLGNKVTSFLGLGSVFGSIGTVSLPRLATGTNYVPQDMVAQIHKGEAVVPKKFNEEQFTNSEETNALLRQLINVVDSKDFKAYISQNEIGKSAVKYINSQSRILGGSIV